eukprot:g7805.t1
MKTDLCVMSGEEKEDMEAVLRRLKTQVKKLAVDYVGETDVGIKARWEKGDLIVNFREASTKVNQYKSVRAVLGQLAQHIRQDERTERNAWSNVEGLTGESHPDFADFQKCVKVIKNKELWTLGKKWRAEPTKPGIMPVHMFATMQTPCQGVGVNPLLTLQQRDDFIAKFWSASNNMSPEDAVCTWGECFMDTQALNPDVVGTTYEGRVGRWVQNDLPALWRTNYRAQERIRTEKLSLRKEAEENRAKDLAAQQAAQAAATAALAAASNWKGKQRGGKRNEPYGKGKGLDFVEAVFSGKKKNVCHPFLAGNCTWGANCKFLHPVNEAQFSKQEFDVVCTEFPDKMKGIRYGQWHSVREKEVEKKDD